MRFGLSTLLLLACAAAPLQAQTCKKVPPPFLPSLLPERVAGMPMEFTSDPSGGCMVLYRPESSAARTSQPWAVVTLAINTGSVGETAESVRSGFTGAVFASIGDWPVMFSQLAKGDEYVAIKGSVKVTVLVKNGDHGPTSEALAGRFFAAILPGVPCG